MSLNELPWSDNACTSDHYSGHATPSLGWIWSPGGCVSCDPGCTHWRIVINAWETWTVAATDGVRCARVRWKQISCWLSKPHHSFVYTPYLGLRCIKQMEISECYMMWKFMMCSGHQIRNYRRLWWVEHVVWRCMVGLSTELWGETSPLCVTNIIKMKRNSGLNTTICELWIICEGHNYCVGYSASFLWY